MDGRRDTPKQVWYSLYALLGTVAVDLGSFGLAAVRSGIGPRFQDVAVYLIGLGILALVMFPIFRGRRWARMVYTIIVALNIGAAFLLMLAPLRPFIRPEQQYYLNIENSISRFLGLFLQILSVHFLYAGESRNWFKSTSGQTDPGMNVAEIPQDSVALPDHETRSMDSPLLAEGPTLRQSAPETIAAKSVRRERHKKAALLAGGLVLAVCIVAGVPVARRARTANAIRRALSADVALALEISGNRALIDCDAKTIHAYAQGLRGIDMSQCPRDFQLAYLAHIEAWESLAQARDLGDLLRSLVVEGSTTGGLPVLSIFGKYFEQEQIKGEITATRNEIERIASSYGVEIPE